MASEERTVLWVGLPAQKKVTETLRGALRRLGLGSQWENPPTAGTEVRSHLASAVIVWVGGTKAELTQYLSRLKAENARGPSPLVVAVASQSQKELLADFASLPVDGVFAVETDADAFAHGMFVLLKGGLEREDLRTQLRDLQLRSARTETVVKQREEFLSVAAHDLRSPLGLIQASLGMVIDGAAKEKTLNPVHLELLTRARRQSMHAINLVNDLLDVMAYEQGLKPVYRVLNLHDLLQEFYEDYRLQSEQKGVKFHYQNTIQDWRVLADSDRVRQLLQNLFVNALKFTDAGKNIFLTVEPFVGRRKSDPPYPMVVISVKDEGKGIPPRELQKIFDRFAQLRDSSRAEGRGLGLTVAKQISTLHDGNIWVQSQEGKGSVFHVLLPHVISRVNALQEAGKRLLVVEPVLERREKEFQVLKDWGYDVRFVKDGVSAIAMAFHEPPAALLFGSELGLIEEGEMVNMLKSESAMGGVPILKMVPQGLSPQKRDDSLIDAYVDLPLSRARLEEILIQLGREGMVPRKAA